MEKQFIDITYDVAKTKYGKKPFTFEQLWTDFVKKAKLDENEQKQAGEVYATMLQDPRFIFVGKGQWKLREFLTLDEQAQLSNALYDFSTVAEEEGEEAEAAKRSKAAESDEDIYFDDETRDEMYNEAKQQALEDDEESEEEDNESESDEESDEDDEEEEMEEEDR